MNLRITNGAIKQRLSALIRRQSKQQVFVLVVALLATGIGYYGWNAHKPAPDVGYSMELPTSVSEESHILIGGDIYWGRRMNDWAQRSSLKEAYPFSRLDEFERGVYDAWIANLECPSVPGVRQPIGFTPQLWEFNCDTSYLPEFAKWFDVVSLANNHTSNQGREKGLELTRQELDKNNIQYFGSFNPHDSKDVCSIISLPARARTNGTQEKVGMPVAMCGFHGVYYTIDENAMAQMEKYARYMPVIAMPHVGKEYRSMADDERRKLFQGMIDHGADMVIGNHSHWVQPAEVYKGKLIVYSMGNFIFDQDFNPEVTRSAAIDITISIPSSFDTKMLKQWIDLGRTCRAPDDSCLSEVEKLQLAHLPVEYRFDIVGVDTSGRITHKANQRLKDEILERLNWHEVKASL